MKEKKRKNVTNQLQHQISKKKKLMM